MVEDVIALAVGVGLLVVAVQTGRYFVGLFTSGVKSGFSSNEPVEPNVATELVATALAKASAARHRAETEKARARVERAAVEIATANTIAHAGPMKWERWETAAEEAAGADDIVTLGALIDAQRELCFNQAVASTAEVSKVFSYTNDEPPLDRPDELAKGLRHLRTANQAVLRCFKLLDLSRAVQAVGAHLDLDNYDSPQVDDEETASQYMRDQLAKSRENFAAIYLRLHDDGVDFAEGIALVRDDPGRFAHTQDATMRSARYLTRLRYATAGARHLRDVNP